MGYAHGYFRRIAAKFQYFSEKNKAVGGDALDRVPEGRAPAGAQSAEKIQCRQKVGRALHRADQFAETHLVLLFTIYIS